MTKKYNKALIAIDGSYFIYFAMFSAVKMFERNGIGKQVLKPVEETDQNNLPDLLKYPEFCHYLEKALIRKFNDVDKLITNILEEYDDINVVHRIISLDSPISNNWRKKIYPEYKIQRKSSPKRFHIGNIMAYCENVIRNKLDIVRTLGYNIIKIDGAEGDDILATILSDTSVDYDVKLLFASDKDFLQIDGIKQFDLFGELKTILPNERKRFNINISPQEYLIIKTLIGDVADNIPAVFKRVGIKKAINLVKNKDLLKEKLQEDQDAAKQFLRNKKIIDFSYIPTELKKNILSYAKELFEEDVKNQTVDMFSDELLAL